MFKLLSVGSLNMESHEIKSSDLPPFDNPVYTTKTTGNNARITTRRVDKVKSWHY